MGDMSRPHNTQGKATYHHGDLRRSLIDNALELIRANGIEGLSLRKLAERVGVSQTALYHYFKDKQDLLLAIGETVVEQFTQTLIDSIASQPPGRQLEAFVVAYIRYARENPELYELLLGRTTWKNARPHAFHQTARHSIRRFGEVLQSLQTNGALPANIDTLRLVQVSWATLHGLCRMYNDGLAFTPEAIEDIARYAAGMMQQALMQETRSS